jgi:hypothetical protein
LISAIIAFFATVPFSIRGKLNAPEIGRSLLTAVGASSISGLATAILTAISADASNIAPNATLALMISYLCSLGLDLLRRKSQGS